jgi:hypothetical protein
VIAQEDGLGDRLEALRVVGDTGNGQQSGHRAARDYQPVPGQLPGPPLHVDDGARPRRDIDRGGVAEHDLGAWQPGPQRYGDPARLQDRRRDLGQQRHVEHVVRGIHRDEVRRFRGQPALQRPQAVVAREACAHDHDPRAASRGLVRRTAGSHDVTLP